ncbi:MAG: hypothetical protein LAO06_09880 [Acidobacteriia bacterium]|nr:hypothetical protein [Terriglobia bacterium]
MTDTFAVSDTSIHYSLRVTNGGTAGGGEDEVSLASITLNGVQVIDPTQFGHSVSVVQVAVPLLASNQIAVRVLGPLGGTITVEIIGGMVGSFAAFGPNVYQGAADGSGPTIDTFSVTDPSSHYLLRVTNSRLLGAAMKDKERKGGQGGRKGEEGRAGVSAASIRINGRQVVSPMQFGRVVSTLEIPVMLESSNQISVAVKGGGGGKITVEIAGGVVGLFTVFGEKTYRRNASMPRQVTDSFSAPDPSASYVLLVGNSRIKKPGNDADIDKKGDDPANDKQDDHGSKDKKNDRKGKDKKDNENDDEGVSGAVVFINGAQVIDEDDFREEPEVIERPVTLAPSDQIGVEVKGKPGGTIDAIILGLGTSGLTITATATPPPNANGWNNTDVVVSFTCAGAVTTCPSPQTVTTEGANQIIQGTAVDSNGNTATATISLNIDKTPPTIVAAEAPLPNAEGWNNSNVTAAFQCGDSLSGVVNCPTPVQVTTEGAGQIITGTVTDLAGNSASTAVKLNIDKTPPSITASASPAPNSAGWNNGNVTVSFQCADSGSGIANCPAPQVISSEGANQIVTGSATDIAGNSATASLTLNIEKTLPSIAASLAPSPNPAGWNNSNVTVSFQCGTSISGAVQCPAPQMVTTEGTNQSVSGTVTDLAGNSATATVTVNLDKTPPTITASASPGPNANGWNNSDVTVSFTCSDSLSGIASCPPARTVSTDGANQTIAGTATDIAGNTATASATVSLDKTPPVITGSLTPAANAAGWNNSDVAVNFACSDAISGVASCTSPVTVTQEGANQVQTGVVVDKAENTASTSVTVNVDKTPPSLAITSPANGSTVNTATIAVNGSDSDLLSGVASVTCNGALATISGANFACTVSLSLGSNSISVQATDVAGNTTTTPLTLTYQPAPPSISLTPNTGTAGTTVSVTINALFNSGFVQGSTAASFGPGTSVGGVTAGALGPVTVTGPNTAIAQVTIAPNALGGTQQVLVQTGSEQISSTFTVNSPAVAAACVPAGSQSLLVQGSNVTAYVPDGIWVAGNNNVEVVPIEGTARRATILTPHVVNSCASNWVTGQTVCTANGTDVYLIQGSALTNTLTSASSGSTGASAGSCLNCGVAINPVTNQAIISMGLSIPGGNANEGIQVLDLNTNTFAAPLAGNDRGVSEGILVDPRLNLVLAPNETNDYELFDLSGGGKVYDRNLGGLFFGIGTGMDSAAEDCSTGIAVASVELSDQLFLTDLTQATFDSTAGTWTAPAQRQFFPEFSAPLPTRLSAGTTGIAVASGAHLGIVTGENGGNAFGVFQLPSTSGSGTPAVLDYVAAIMPNDPSGHAWQSGSDPHPVAAYISPNDGKAYGVVTNDLGSFLANGLDRYLAIIDLQGLLNAPRSAAHTADSTVDLAATGLVRFVRILAGTPAQMTFTTQPAGAVAGQFFPVQLAIEDAQGNLVVNAVYNVTLTVSGGGASLGSKSVNTTNGVATFSIAIQQAGTYTISASAGNLPPIASDSFTITPAAAAKLSFATQPANVTAGQPLPTIQVAWLDQYGNPTPSTLPITLALSTNGYGATLSGTTTAVAANGVASFTGLTVDRDGTFTLTASGNAAQATSGQFQVTSAAAAQLAFIHAPTTAPAGQAMSIVQLAVEDAFGNIVTSANNDLVTLALGANPSGATLSALFPGTTSVLSNGGYATFYYLTVNSAGLGYTMVASSPGLKSATSTAFNITGSGPPLSLTPATMTQGTTSSITITTQNTHFQQGVTTASFGPGLAVGSGLSGGYGLVNVTSSTTAIAQVSAAVNATPGPRTVVLQTVTEQYTFFDSFAVLGIPFLNSISPGSGQPGQTVSVTINGEFTNFVQGTTQANFGPGVSVGGGAQGGYGPVTVTGPRTAVAQVLIAANASVGLRSPIAVQTGAQQASLSSGGFLVLGPITGPAPAFSFTSLTEGMEITAPTAVTGTITSPNLSSWTLDYAPSGSNSFTAFASGTTAAVSGTLDPTLLVNGIITVRLTAVDQSGQTTSTTANVVITRKLKVGIFTLSFLDLNIPVAGIPIQVVRTYDSRNKTVGDFGVGWTLAVKSVQVHTSGILGNNWIGTSSGGVLPTYCVVAGQDYVVSVRLQNGAVYQFQPVPTPDTQCSQVLPPSIVDLTFVPTGSTPPTAQLTQGNSTGLMVSGGFPGALKLVDPFTFEAYGFGGDADQWTLTMPTGQTLQVSVTSGVQAISDRNGNTLNIGPNGITSSSGPAVTFNRDAQNRIVSIRDPNLNLLQYGYDNSGDLTSFVDQRSNVSTFTYDAAHDLISYTDPTGAQPIRNVYDDSGRLIQQIDALGHVQNFAHDMAGNTETFTDFLGNSTTYVYDSHGNIVRETDALGNVTSKTFDANDKVLTETNALVKTTSYTYDANGNRSSATDPLGNTTRFTYNTLNEVLTTTDPNGSTTRKTYDSVGNLLTLADPLGNTTARTYTISGLLATLTDPLGNTTGFAYDSKGNLTGVTDPLGTVTNFAYDANGNRVSQTVVRTTGTGHQTLTTQYQYDARNRLVKTVFPDGSTTQTTLNALGQQSAKSDELGRQTDYSYDADGLLVSTNYADGTSETNTYDAVGNKVASTDRSGTTTTYTYDPLHRPLTNTDPLGAVVSSAYDAAGQKILSTDARGNVTRYGYDDAGRQTTVTNPLGEVAQLTLDGAALPISAKDPAGHVTAFGHDAAGRVTQVTHPDGSIDTMTYDAGGSIAARTDATGKTTQFAHDSLRRLASVTDALGHTTNYGYDELGNRVSISDANGRITRFQYDQRGRRINRTLPGGQSETSTYDEAGELASHTDFNGRTSIYAYDSVGRLLSKTPDPSFHAPAVSYTYTVSGRRASMTDASGTTTYGYDALGRLTSKQSPEGNITHSYDLAGNVVELKSGTLEATYSYDELNRLASVTEPATGTTSYSYDPVGNLQNIAYPNGIVHAYTYDSQNHLTNLAVNNNGAPTASYSYTLDPAGHRLSVAELGGRAVNYTYDAIYRLTGESVTGASGGPDGAVSYTYDPVGNRTQTTSTLAGISPGSFSYDPDDRLSLDNYDAAGNTISSGGIGNVYDFENRLLQHGSVTIAYDGDGNRVAETVGGVTTAYLVDEGNLTGFPQVIAETGSDGSTRTYVYGLQRISQTQVIPGANSSTTSYYLYDGHGSVRALADAAGAITDTYDYDAFGSVINRAGTNANNFLFAGEQFDPALGIYYNRARYYDQGRGRFWSMDTLDGYDADPQSLHKYLYTRADPVNHRDPSGNQDDLIEEAAALEISAELSTTAVAESAEVVSGTAFTAASPVGEALADTLVADTLLAESAAAGEAAVTAEEVALWNAELQAQIAATQAAWWEGLTAAQRAEWLFTELETLMEGVADNWVARLFAGFK